MIHDISLLEWSPVSARITDRAKEVLESWRGTPYMPGQQCKGGGVDCVRFVCGVLDEFRGDVPQGVESLPQDICLHNKAGAIAGMKRIMERYSPVISIDRIIEPLDVVVVGPANGGPGHALIAGYQPNTLWHSIGRGVQVTGLGLNQRLSRLFKIYRMAERDRWQKS